jgi:hypothetical protein
LAKHVSLNDEDSEDHLNQQARSNKSPVYAAFVVGEEKGDAKEHAYPKKTVQN